MGEGDDIRREGATTRAALRDAQRELAEVREQLQRAENDARTLAEFIERSSFLHAWTHDDVVSLFLAARRAMDILRAQNKASAARGAPASHILYDRMIRQAEEDCARQIEDLIRHGLHSPERLTEDMRNDILDRLRRKD